MIGGIVGAVVGFLVGLLITEVMFSNSAFQSGFDWQFWTDILLTIVGALAGAAVARRWRVAVHRATSRRLAQEPHQHLLREVVILRLSPKER